MRARLGPPLLLLRLRALRHSLLLLRLKTCRGLHLLQALVPG